MQALKAQRSTDSNLCSCFVEQSRVSINHVLYRARKQIDKRQESFMRNCVGALVLALCVAPATMAKPPQQESKSAPPPAWAYGFDTPIDLSAGTPTPAPAGVPEADDGTLRHLPGS